MTYLPYQIVNGSHFDTEEEAMSHIDKTSICLSSPSSSKQSHTGLVRACYCSVYGISRFFFATQTPCLVEISSHSPAGPSKLDPHMERLVVDAILGGQASLQGACPILLAHSIFYNII